MYMIFLYRFDLKENGIDFVLNEQIAADILPQYDVLLRPLVTLLTSNMRENGEIEVMLNQELGQCIDGDTKKHMILKNGKRIADILIEIRNAYTIYH
ncbi:hypothetical protein BK784_04000 [Bacillus thuringiensis serovar medellin]|uniref:Uncharacterized protein n=1 Tax=Bacillus thuringiensis subsp. medellin TaxID=79672 RepID=A0A9X6RIQ1_BACTV|nr:hypothetical protein [Bacillus thuringiensis]OUC03358.1 hypothetical protein BK784_04000 [Bacillus thuringiensis serovar medellin]